MRERERLRETDRGREKQRETWTQTQRRERDQDNYLELPTITQLNLGSVNKYSDLHILTLEL
jgi:hypothetical protein